MDFEIINPEWDERYRAYWQAYHAITDRQGISAEIARIEMRRRLTLIGVMMMHQGDADGLLCGTNGMFHAHLAYVDQVIGRRPGAQVYAAMNTLMLKGRQLTIVDTHVNAQPTAEQLVDITLMAADELRRFGILPKVALLSHSNFGTSNAPSVIRMREALALLRERAPELEVDGEMHGDCALDPRLRAAIMPRSTLSGEANLLVMPGLDAANISYNLLKTAAGNNVAVGPVLLGAARPVHVLTASATVRRIVNMTAWTAVDIDNQRR